MTETKFTPGPWVAIRNSAFWEINPENRRDKDPYSVGDCCSSEPNNPDGGLQEANAHLIAAAPELHEALNEEAQNHRAEYEYHAGNGNDEAASYHRRRFEKINALLAKARGEQS